MKSITSVIVTTFNYGRFLETAINSVLSQTVQPAEIIVVDDGSTDETDQVLKQFGRRVRVLKKENGGQASAFNLGLAHASGDLVSLLDADDWWAREKVEAIEYAHSEALAAGISVAMLRHDLLVCRDGGGYIGRMPGIERPLIHPPRDLRRVLSERLSVPTSGLTLTHQTVAQITPIPEPAFRVCADAYLYVMAGAAGAIVDVPKVLGYYRLHKSNAYSRSELDRLPKLLNLEIELVRAVRNKGIDPYIPHFVFRLARQLRANPAELPLSTFERIFHVSHARASLPRRVAIILREILEGWSGSTLGRPTGRASIAPLASSRAASENLGENPEADSRV